MKILPGEPPSVRRTTEAQEATLLIGDAVVICAVQVNEWTHLALCEDGGFWLIMIDDDSVQHEIILGNAAETIPLYVKAIAYLKTYVN